MKATVLASGKPGFELDIHDALVFAGRTAGICYMPEDFDALLAEPVEKTEKRASGTLLSGHHSVFDHLSYTLLLEGVPKLLAMILNNEKAYATSEKSARYTLMNPSPRERVLYDKWLDLVETQVRKSCADVDEVKAHKLAQENARYMISVMTPTVMAYTASLRQWNYIIHWLERFLAQECDDPLFALLRPRVEEFVSCLDHLRVDGLNDAPKDRDLSLFDTRTSRKGYFGEGYCTTYMGSFAQLAQAHRHRTLDYKMRVPEYHSFYVPPIVAEDETLELQWREDIASVGDVFPQGMLVSITERGTYENFILKTKERLCSAAQLEVMRQTWTTLQNYLRATEGVDQELFEILSRYNVGARCGAGFKCPTPCRWGVKQLDRPV